MISYVSPPPRHQLAAGRRYKIRVPGYHHLQTVDVVRAGRGLAFKPVTGIGGLMGPVSRVGRFEIMAVRHG